MEYTDDERKYMYDSYESVRAKGQFNMFSDAARMATMLSKQEYLYVMEHYSELKEQFGGK